MSLMPEMTARLVYIWTCQPRFFMRSNAPCRRWRPALGSLLPPVARLSLMPRMPAAAIASRSLSLVLSSITATPRTSLPRPHVPESHREIGALDALRHALNPLHLQRALQRPDISGCDELGRV